MGVVVAASSRQATSWHFFRDAARLLLTDDARGGGLDIYLAHPEFQFGPLAVLVAAPFALLPGSLGVSAVLVLGTLLGAAATVGVELTIRRLAGPGQRALWRRGRMVGELTLAIVWADVAVRTAHLDDAIALSSASLACAAVAHRRPAWATAALTIAAAAKPWAIVFAPLVLVPSGRLRATRMGAMLAGAALTWLPFIIDEPRTISTTGSFTITNAPSSALRAFGVSDPATPNWIRPTQFAAGLVLALVLVRTRRWPAVIMAGLALRLLLDPGVHHYYSAGLVLGVLLWEGVARPGRLPLLTILSAVVMEVTPSDIHPSSVAGALRLALTGGLIIVAFAWPYEVRSPRPADRRDPGSWPGGANSRLSIRDHLEDWGC